MTFIWTQALTKASPVLYIELSGYVLDSKVYNDKPELMRWIFKLYFWNVSNDESPDTCTSWLDVSPHHSGETTYHITCWFIDDVQ